MRFVTVIQTHTTYKSKPNDKTFTALFEQHVSYINAHLAIKCFTKSLIQHYTLNITAINFDEVYKLEKMQDMDHVDNLTGSDS